MPTVTFKTSGTSWTVPSDWNSSNNTIELIGGGAGGNDANANEGGAGGGGGEYRKLINQAYAPSEIITIQLGQGGTHGNGGIAGTDTTINATGNGSVVGRAKGGLAAAANSATGGAGGTGGTGGTSNHGGSGGNSLVFADAAAGGGGAGGPNGIGAAGGAATTNGSAVGGAGGGGNGGGSVGGTTSSVTGGTGGNNSSATGGGSGGGAGLAGSAGTAGGGGGGGGGQSAGISGVGGAGGAGIEWDSTHGSGGGGGGGGTGPSPSAGGNGGLYGGGGGGGAQWTTNGLGGNAANGIIVITYTPSTAPAETSASINSAGTSLTINFSTGSPPILPASGVTGFSLSGTSAAITATAISGSTATLTLSPAVFSVDVVTLNYTPGNVTDSAGTPLPLAAFTGRAVTNNSTVIAPPTETSASINSAGTTLTVTFSTAAPPILPASGITGFSLAGTSAVITTTSVSGSTGTFTLSPAALLGETVTLGYTPGNVTDSAGSPHSLAAFSGRTVTNNSTVIAPPTETSASINAAGTTLIVTFSTAAPPILPAISVNGFTLGGTTSATITSGSISTTTGTFTLSPAVLQDDVPTLGYSSIIGNVTDSEGTPKALATFSGRSVTNNSILTLPGTPTGLSLTTISSTEIDALWSAGAGGTPTSYTLQWDYQGNLTSDSPSVPILVGDTGTPNIPLEAGKSYDFRVKANNAGGSSAYSSPIASQVAISDRTIVWNSVTNAIPIQTPPTITVVYASDRKSATVTMSCDVQGATIKYSTNGRYATTHTNSLVYAGPITVHQSGVFHACWYFNGLKSHAAHAPVYLKN
jgi:hypothetical protein